MCSVCGQGVEVPFVASSWRGISVNYRADDLRKHTDSFASSIATFSSEKSLEKSFFQSNDIAHSHFWTRISGITRLLYTPETCNM